MRELILHRRFLGDNYTIGRLSVDGVSYCDVLEDKVRDFNKDGDLSDDGEEKVYGKTAIPYGKYRVVVTMSERFKRKLPLLMDVPHFTCIRIHGGNTEADTLGCLLVGENKIKGKVINCKKYVDELTNWIEMWQKAGDETWITII